jgi:FtsP/CotA-like multicopper oxidase with cupredoxin domain
MRIATVGVCAMVLVGLGPTSDRYVNSTNNRAVEQIVVNDNRTAAGVLANGVLTIRIEAREGEWHPDRDADPGLVVRAFGEEGKPLRVPGPLIRVPEGTVIHAFIRNSLRDSALVVSGLSPRGGATSTQTDTIRVKPGEVREVRFSAGAAGTYYYRGRTNAGGLPGAGAIDPELHGAFIVDPRGTTAPASDRVFVLGLWNKNAAPGRLPQVGDLVRFTINGKAWPNTERVAYKLGDTVRFRLINVSSAVHPMHLHGFYFNVDSRGDGTLDSIFDPSGSPHRVVTERAAVGRTFTMHWVPERPGYWMFHCHDNAHVLRNAPLDGTPRVPEYQVRPQNHALEMMGGLVMGIEVRDSGMVQASTAPSPRRRLRLIARADSGGTVAEPAYGFVLQDGARMIPSTRPFPIGPAILLKRGEPVSITVVNELPEPTSVHWHGIELDSYYDGVAGFAGHPGRIAPAIAPRDSFEARFTPPRAGTFIYHPHADEMRQQQAGLVGALIVLDSLEQFDAKKDILLLVSVPRAAADGPSAVFLNGTTSPGPLDLHVGERYRIRLVNIHTFRPSMIARLLRDSTPVAWRAIAKDGMDLPNDQATVRPAVQQMGNGETYDFELTPAASGDLRFTVSSAAGVLLASMAVHVR